MQNAASITLLAKERSETGIRFIASVYGYLNQRLPLLIFLFVGMHGIFIVITGYIDGRHLQRIDRDNLEIHPALIALHSLAFFYLIGINDNRVIAFGTYNSHDQSSRDLGSPTRL